MKQHETGQPEADAKSLETRTTNGKMICFEETGNLKSFVSILFTDR